MTSPTRNPYQATNHGAPNIFITKFTPDGSGFVYSTYLGGSNGEFGAGIAVDSRGDAYVSGTTTSTDFPVTTGALQTVKPNHNANYSGFVTALNPAGNGLVYSTYLVGTCADCDSHRCGFEFPKFR